MSLQKVKKYIDPAALLVSIILALLVWIYVDNRRIENKTVKVSLLLNLAEGWELSSDVPKSITVVLQGPKEQMKGMAVNTISLNKTITAPSKHDVYTENILIKDADLRLPSGVAVLSVSPSQIEVTVVRLVPQYVRVRPVFEGKPAKGYRVLRMDADPSYVEVMVPKGLVKPGDFLECYPIDVSGKAEDIYRRVGVQPAELTGGRKLQTDKGIDVSVIIEPIPAVKVLKKVPVRVLYGPILGLRIMKINPPTVTLEIEGSKAILDNLTEKDPIVYVDTSDITGEVRGEHILRCRIHLPVGVVVKDIVPKEVKITVK